MIGFNYLGKLGQLGNQMFQYAATKGIARYHNYQFCVPNHNDAVKDNLGNILRIELFDAFDLKPDEVAFLQTSSAYREDQFHFDQKLFEQCPDGVCLYGFFQSEKYFKHIEDDIREDFTFHSEIEEAYQEIASILENPIALHIRRGDFLINSENHHNLSLNYYRTALDQFDSTRQVVVFSDDSDWCQEQEIFSDDRFLISSSNSSYVDLCIMSHCSDFIIANSTFSWWGAWLSKNKNKTVFYPSKWFGPNNVDKSTKDLFPKEWRMINED